MPAIIPAAGASPSYMPKAASWPISRNGAPGSSRPSTRSRGKQLAARRVPLARLGVAAERDLGGAGAQIVDLALKETRRCSLNSSERVSMRDLIAAMALFSS